ncbi:polysulfide reductase NrfD [Coraliomargarita sp. SDUM461004]|uniref:Polysulfide reductase NrfD n=1 Tax=Thalassobacterium sedimentorum TaxID=3041258 RepID=A0ABU1ALL3_9BACT|nr:NrfD/PsrC family molybdoenzyme membrane anchor subunit [Coraliomargarita sp. SDUM461004]MDQ8194483.1 polysulfide reductase NrfD [Coraliomargarita sp. SDUM461004]
MHSEIVYNIQHGPIWDWKVAMDLFLGGAGVGALLFSISLDEFFEGKYQRICRTAAWLSPILIGLGLLLIMLKMGRPFSAYHTYLNVNLTSPLWWGGIFQPMLVGGGLVYSWLWWKDAQHIGLRRLLGRILIPLTFIVGAYHGLLLAVLGSHPLWNTGPTVIAALLAFATSGIATVMLVHFALMKLAGRLDDEAHVASFLDDLKAVRNTLGGLLAAQLGVLFFWWLSLYTGSLQDQQALRAANESHGPMFWGLGIGLGLILPIAFGLYSMLRGESKHRRTQIYSITVSSLLIVVGAFFFRLALILGGQSPVPVNLTF